ncbi:MAG: MBL fold metallo-hydrolase, partial [Gammaproteobacteria bacterium]|nr:MBL fold metallo-hydrolase [Gammaproteobacteria bacterium]
MTSRLIRALAVICVVASPALAQDSDISFKSTKVASGIYMLEGIGGFAGGNLGILTGEDGVVLID